MNFEHHADRVFFASLLCEGDVALLAELYGQLFDFRPPAVKRAEFNRLRPRLLADLIRQFGRVCMLQYPSLCQGGAILQVDHFIPLSSNVLNKMIRQLPSETGKKVQTQSFGSNNPANLLLACPRCNAFKKHRMPTRELMTTVNAIKTERKT
ncbi:MAG: HNH endonuclease signature motif containing protein [Candidatus Peregrinibacteria bacterium]